MPSKAGWWPWNVVSLYFLMISFATSLFMVWRHLLNLYMRECPQYSGRDLIVAMKYWGERSLPLTLLGGLQYRGLVFQGEAVHHLLEFDELCVQEGPTLYIAKLITIMRTIEQFRIKLNFFLKASLGAHSSENEISFTCSIVYEWLCTRLRFSQLENVLLLFKF